MLAVSLKLNDNEQRIILDFIVLMNIYPSSVNNEKERETLQLKNITKE
jgi:hypothetical protein